MRRPARGRVFRPLSGGPHHPRPLSPGTIEAHPLTPGAVPRPSCSERAGHGTATASSSCAARLYAELLAEEVGLYADERGLLGSISTSLMRAARLVVDTGLHFYGWSREQALEFVADHVPMPREFLADEVDRYVVMPGQALAYLTGKLEIIRIREEAQRRLGPAFSLPHSVRFPTPARIDRPSRASANSGPFLVSKLNIPSSLYGLRVSGV